jgi:hypothetical protein
MGWPRSPRARVTLALLVVATYVIGTVIARRRGYNMGGNVIVRCRRGHLFTTIWIPGVSLTALRLGWYRLQWCPVGRHWSLVTPVNPRDLNDDVRLAATVHRDLRLP